MVEPVLELTMPNFASLLKAEIARLARKEVRSELQALRKASASHRKQIASLRRSLSAVERAAKRTPRTSSQEMQDAAPKTRFVAKGFQSLRKRFGLSADQMGKVLGVSMQSVYNWERKKATPRPAQLAGIAELRTLGKKAVLARLTSKSTAKPSPKKAKRARTQRPRASAKQRRVKYASQRVAKTPSM